MAPMKFLPALLALFLLLAPQAHAQTVSAARTVSLPTASIPPATQLRWPTLAPGDTADFSLNIHAYLAEAGDTIASYTAQVDSGNSGDLTLVSTNAVAGSLMTVWLNAGSTIADHSVTFHVITAAGRALNVAVWVKVIPASANTSAAQPVVIGPPGHSTLVGQGAPGLGIGRSGDSYIDSVSGEVWLRSLSAWTDTGANIMATSVRSAGGAMSGPLIVPSLQLTPDGKAALSFDPVNAVFVISYNGVPWALFGKSGSTSFHEFDFGLTANSQYITIY
jgi:hypothetical protein